MKKFLKILFFYPLLWLRGIVLGLGKFFGTLYLLGFIFTLFMDIFWGIKVVYAVLACMTFLLCHFYDQILFKLNPTNGTLYLKQ